MGPRFTFGAGACRRMVVVDSAQFVIELHADNPRGFTMKPWVIVTAALALFFLLIAAFAAGPAAVFVMLDWPGESAAASGAAVSLDQATALNAAQIERLTLEVRGQYLDDRAESITWWLMAAAISLAFITVFVTALGIIIVIAGFFGYQQFRDILNDARGYTADAQHSAAQAQQVAEGAASTAGEAERLADVATERVERIEETRERAQQEFEKLRNITAEEAATSRDLQDLANRVDAMIGLNPSDHTIAEAIRLQSVGDSAAAIEKWQAIAIIMEGIDDERAARAWFSVGFLHTKAESKDYKAAISAFDKSIALKQGFVQAYNNRGVAKSELECDKDAIKDYDIAIGLDDTYSVAYINRGGSKFNLGRFADAKDDYLRGIRHNREPEWEHLNLAYCNLGEVEIELKQYKSAVKNCTTAIQRNPELGEAYYHRGRAQSALGNAAEARSDFETASKLADEQSDSVLKEKVQQTLADLDDAA